MIACVFSGQGAQQPGMGQELCRSNDSARRVYAEASALLGIDLLQLTEEQLATTRFAQLSIVTLSLAAWEAFRDGCKLEGPQSFAGFSLGEYSAMGAAGVLGLPDLLALVNERARLMQQRTRCRITTSTFTPTFTPSNTPTDFHADLYTDRYAHIHSHQHVHAHLDAD